MLTEKSNSNNGTRIHSVLNAFVCDQKKQNETNKQKQHTHTHIKDTLSRYILPI
eukprot:UN08627